MANGQRGESKATMKSERVGVIHAVSSMAPIHQKPIDIFHATSMLKLEGFDMAGTWLGKASAGTYVITYASYTYASILLALPYIPYFCLKAEAHPDL